MVCVCKYVISYIVWYFFDQIIYTDVALDPYSSDGHDGIVREDGETDAPRYLVVFMFWNKLNVSMLKKWV